MRRTTLKFGEGFHLAVGNQRSQAAQMTLGPGDTEGGPDNRHRGSDQGLFIVEGTGCAIINGHKYDLTPGVLMLIEQGDLHEIRANPSGPLRTLNIYVPPAYVDDDTPLPKGKP